MSRLTEHFVLAEFDCSDGTKVPAAARDELVALCRGYLEPLRARYGRVTVHSGYRTAAVNRRVGGAVNSFHRYDLAGRYGVAADVTCAKGRPSDWATFLEQLRAGGVGRYGSFVHVDNRRVLARWRG